MISPKAVFSNKTYNILKYIAQIVLPASGTLYFALSQIWGFPAGEEVLGTIVAVDVFLGILLGVSSSNYYESDAWYDGTLELVETDRAKHYSLNLDGYPEDLDKKDYVVFKVDHTLEGS